MPLPRLVLATLASLAIGGAIVAVGAGDRATGAVRTVDGSASAAAPARRVFSSPGNPAGVELPSNARRVDTSHPDRIIGTGTPSSCTSRAVVDAVARGGVITFDCGPDLHT
ncbi:MAG: hypothetical protein WBP59_06050, partial [Ilumatobacteraceae bacterium]